jgi:hypothetical protein
MHKDERTVATRAMALGGGAALLWAVAFAGSVSAGQTQPAVPTAEVTSTTCGDAGGTITVNIFDDFAYTYDVLLDGTVVPGGDGRTDTDEGEDPMVIGPLADGTYTVTVIWNEAPDEPDAILEEEVTVDCVTDETTPPTTAPAAPEPETAPVVASPTYTG